ncbi:hypothetical protein F5B20DRAFT_477533 [Whalleya microplaca]|nr:hypothetical protein F5B20DRAFT_477533 [Whalleya microplaca]
MACIYAHVHEMPCTVPVLGPSNQQKLYRRFVQPIYYQLHYLTFCTLSIHIKNSRLGSRCSPVLMVYKTTPSVIQESNRSTLGPAIPMRSSCVLHASQGLPVRGVCLPLDPQHEVILIKRLSLWPPLVIPLVQHLAQMVLVLVGITLHVAFSYLHQFHYLARYWLYDLSVSIMLAKAFLQPHPSSTVIADTRVHILGVNISPARKKVLLVRQEMNKAGVWSGERNGSR